MKDVKIVIGANYGDEGKGLMTRHFCLDAQEKGLKPVVVFHNGTAQRGHTVDYSPTFRHVYHHFGSGTGDGVPTFFADTFLIHPMEFRREYIGELIPKNLIPPIAYCDPAAKVITPFDMVVDHCTLEHIAKLSGDKEFEHGTCGYGSWCAAEDRLPANRTSYTVFDFLSALDFPSSGMYESFMEAVWEDCLSILASRGVDIEKSGYAHLLKNRTHLIENFKNDLMFFKSHTRLICFDTFYLTSDFDAFIFENGQGLGLDMNNGTEWHTTSNTGIINPYNMLKHYHNFDAEVCYVTRSYLTRHGEGPLEDAAKKHEINPNIVDKTNIFNDFQGNLRFGFMEGKTTMDRVNFDFFNNVTGDSRFKKEIAITHTNEFDCNFVSKYRSDNPFSVKEYK